jgi:hypothetical protein
MSGIELGSGPGLGHDPGFERSFSRIAPLARMSEYNDEEANRIFWID